MQAYPRNSPKGGSGRAQEVNVMHPACVAKLGLSNRKTDVDAQKINGPPWVTFGMVIAGLSFRNKLRNVRFSKRLLPANTSIEVLGMPFLTLSSADRRFAERELVWRTYTPTTRKTKRLGCL